MIELYLKTDNEDQMRDALEQAGISYDEETQQYTHADFVRVVPLPFLSRPTGNMIFDEETGTEFEEQALIPGCHFNVYTTNEDIVHSLSEFEVTPKPQTPMVKRL